MSKPTINKPALAGGTAAAALALAVGIIAPWEGKSNDPYLDLVKVPTVCFGETQVEMRRYTDAECEAMLIKAADTRYMQPVMKCTPSIADNPHVLAAATSLAYNIGTGAYCKSTVAKRFNAGQIRAGCEGFTAWRFAGGREVKGLLNRRIAERELCLRGVA